MKILVMDDDSFICDFISEIIEMSGHQSVITNKGETAIELFKKAFLSKQPFDAVFLDIIVRNGMGGIDTLRILKKIDKNINTIIISGENIDKNSEEYSSFAINHTINKPFTITQMSQLIDNIAKSQNK